MSENEIQHVEVAAVEMTALESMERASIDVQIATAKKYPRSIERFHKNAIDMIRMNDRIAAECVYNRPVGKDAEGGKMKYAEGPSIRLAEIAAACYGNLRVATIITEITPRQVKAQGFAIDLEKNFAVKKDCVESTVTSKGIPFTERMRLVVAKAAQSKALRDAIFSVIPRSLCTELVNEAKRIAIGEGKTLEQSRIGLMDWIKELKIEPARVWQAIGIEGKADVTTEHLTTLAGLRTAINDGDCTVDEAFPPLTAEKNEKGGGDVAGKIMDHFAGKEEKKEPEPPKENKKRGRPKKNEEAPTENSSDEQKPSPPPEAVFKFQCKRCSRKWLELKDGKCPWCMGDCVEL